MYNMRIGVYEIPQRRRNSGPEGHDPHNIGLIFISAKMGKSLIFVLPAGAEGIGLGI